MSPARAMGSSPPPRIHELGADAMTDLQITAEQPNNEKTTAYRTNTSKQKKTNEEKQAKKNESDRAMLQGGV